MVLAKPGDAPLSRVTSLMIFVLRIGFSHALSDGVCERPTGYRPRSGPELLHMKLRDNLRQQTIPISNGLPLIGWTLGMLNVPMPLY